MPETPADSLAVYAAIVDLNHGQRADSVEQAKKSAEGGASINDSGAKMGFFTRRGGVIDERDTHVDLEGETKDDLDSGDHERFAHYVKKEKIVESAVSGKPVTALCGKRWIPNRDPKKFPICPTCKEIYSGFRKGPDGSGDSGSGNSGSGNSGSGNSGN